MLSLDTQLFKNLDISRPQIKLLDLHLFRVIYCSLLIWIHVDRHNFYLRSMVQSPNFHPIPLFEIMGIGRFDLETFHWVFVALMATLVLSTIGVATRWNLLISSCLFFLVHGQLLSLTKSPDSPYVYHSENLTVFVLLILAFDSNIARNSLITRWRRVIQEGGKEFISSHSLNLIIIAMGFVYFGATYVRLVKNGLGWMDGFTLKSAIMNAHFSDRIELAHTVAKHHYVCMALSIGVTIFELGFLLLFFFKRSYLVLLLSSLCFHLSILIIMNINFFPYYGFAFFTYLFLPPFSLGTRLCEKWLSYKGLGYEDL